jgi:hypothetical protein
MLEGKTCSLRRAFTREVCVTPCKGISHVSNRVEAGAVLCGEGMLASPSVGELRNLLPVHFARPHSRRGGGGEAWGGDACIAPGGRTLPRPGRRKHPLPFMNHALRKIKKVPIAHNYSHALYHVYRLFHLYPDTCGR